MAWFINRSGQPEGPFEEAQIIQMIQSGQLSQANICPQGGNQWMPLGQHPPFGQALQGGAAVDAGGRQSAPPATQAMEAMPPEMMAALLAGGGAQPGPGPQGGQPMGGPMGGQPMGGPMGGQPMGGQPMGGPMGGQPMGGQPMGAQAGYGGPAQLGGAAPQGGGGGAKKGPPMALIAGAGAAVVLLIVGIVAVVMMMGGGSALSKSVPEDTEIFIEIPDVRGALAAAMDMDVIDSKLMDPKKRVEEGRDGIKDAFGLSQDDAEDLLGSVASVGLAVRNADKDDRTAMLIAFKSRDGVEALLKSDRFEKSGEVGGGVRYLVKRVEEDDYDKIKEWSPARKTFSFMSYQEDSKRMLVWFEDAKIMAMGHKTMIEDIGGVLSGDDASLAKSDKWARAKVEKGDAIVFVDSALVKKSKKEDFEKFAKGYLDDVAPFTGELKFTSAGMVMSARGELKGNKISEDDAVPSAGSLDIFEKLPKETVAYMAFSTAKSEDGKAARKRLLKQMKGVDDDAAEKFEKGLDELKEKLGVGLEDILDAVGNELVIALLVDEGYQLDLEKDFKESLDKFAVVLMFEIGDEEKAKDVVDKLRKKPFDEKPLSEIYDVEKKDDGWNAVPKEEAAKTGLPPIKVRIANDHVMIAAGGSALVTAAAKALKGDGGALGDDAAHKAAIDAVSNKAHMVTWLDAGRIAGVGLKWAEDQDKMKEQLDGMEKQVGFSYKAIKIAGEKRLTAAASFRAESDGETMKWEIHTLNAPAFGVLAGLAVFKRLGGGGRPEPVPMPTAGGAGDSFEVNTGSSDCDALIRRLQQCAKDKDKSYITDMAKSSHDAYKKSIDNAKGNKFVVRAVGRTCNDGLANFTTRYTMCN